MTIGNNDLTTRKAALNAAKEIKASSHYGYVNQGITLDGSKFAVGELVVEGTCLARRKTSGKFEKYADGTPAKAKVTGGANITPADLSGLHANTKVEITVNGIKYTVGNAALKAVGAATTEAEIVTLIKNAVNVGNVKLETVADVSATAGHKLVIETKDAGSGKSVLVDIIVGTDGDEATVEGVLGVQDGDNAVGTGAWNELFDYPVIMDESVQFRADDVGNNPDMTAGQVLVHGSVYKGMLVGITDAFITATPMIRYE